MKLNELQGEKTGRSAKTKISELKALELLKGPIKNNHEAARRTPFYKCMKDASDFIIFDTIGKVKSPFMLDALVDDLSSWRSTPKRTMGTKMWSSTELAENANEGSLYVIFPFDGTRVVIAPEPTFYRSFKHAALRMHIDKLDNKGLNEWIGSMLRCSKALNLGSDDTEVDSPKEFITRLKDLEHLKHDKELIKMIEDLKLPDVDERRIFAFLKRTGSTLSYFNSLLDPQDNGFNVMTSLFDAPKGREAWATGKSLAIKLDKYRDLHKRGDVK